MPASNLYLKFLPDGYEVALTRGTENHTSPRFSPDSKKLYWLSTRKPATPAGGNGPSEGAAGGIQIWSVDVRGGEPVQVTRLDKGVRAFNFIDAQWPLGSNDA